MSFIYNGENERPVRPLNFRDTKRGGLGLIEPMIKSKALFLKNIMKENSQSNVGLNLTNARGEFGRAFHAILNELGAEANSNQIYKYLLKNKVERNGSLIPSRNERNLRGIKWGPTWKNLTLIKGLNSDEKCFGWKLTQDMVAVGRRIHRKGSDQLCKRLLDNGIVCNELDTLDHCFFLLSRNYRLLCWSQKYSHSNSRCKKQILCLSFNC